MFRSQILSDIEIIGAAQSVYVRTTRIAFEEKGVPYLHTPAAPHSPEVNVLHPFGKIPVMRHGDFVLFESRAIATYIDRAFEGPLLIPGEAKLAAEVEQWISALSTSVFPGVVVYLQANAFPKGPNGSRDETVIAAKLPIVGQCIDILNRAISKTGNLVGATFTLADMYLMPLLGYLRIFPESGEMVAASNLSSYYAKHSARDSLMRTVPPPLGDLRG